MVVELVQAVRQTIISVGSIKVATITSTHHDLQW